MFLRWFSASSQSWRRSSEDRFQATSMDSAPSVMYSQVLKYELNDIYHIIGAMHV